MCLHRIFNDVMYNTHDTTMMTAVTRKRGDVRDVSMAARCAFAFVVVVRCTYGLRCCFLYLTQVNSTTRLVVLINDNPLNHVRAMDNESIRPYPKRERPSTILYSYIFCTHIANIKLAYIIAKPNRRFISKMVHWFLHGMSDSVPGKPIKLLSNLKHNRTALIRTKRPIQNASYMTHIRRVCNIML